MDGWRNGWVGGWVGGKKVLTQQWAPQSGWTWETTWGCVVDGGRVGGWVVEGLGWFGWAGGKFLSVREQDKPGARRLGP